MELRHLRYFVAVAEALSFRKASEVLRVAQPALSRQVKDLEGHLGTALLDRSTTGVSLTDAGGVFLEEARDILERADQAVAAARDAGSGIGGRLLIGSMGPISSSFLPAALAEYRTRYPKVDVNIRDFAVLEQMAALKSGAVQIGFTINNTGVPLPGNVDSLPVLEARIAIAMSYHHRLAQASEVSLRDFEEETFLCAEGPGKVGLHRQRTLSILAAQGVGHRPIKQVGSFESLLTLVAGNHGIALMLPSHAVRNAGHVVYKRIREESPEMDLTLSVLWRKGTGSRLALNFIEVLKTQLGRTQ